MIKKTIVCTLLLLIGYHFVLQTNTGNSWSVSQHQWQENIIKAEHFLFSNTDSIDGVILGSSLSSRMVTSELPRFYNLAFGGASVFDGLNLLKNKSKVPKQVYIEMNTILREENSELTATVSSPVFNKLKGISPAFLEDKKPMAVVGEYFLRFNRGLRTTQKKTAIEVDKEEISSAKVAPSNTEETIFFKMKKIQYADYSTLPDNKQMEDAFSRLKKAVVALENRGCVVSFFEIPVNHELMVLPKAETIRKKFFDEYSTNTYHYIALPDSKYMTSDGLHLKPVEALEYTHHFLSQLKIID